MQEKFDMILTELKKIFMKILLWHIGQSIKLPLDALVRYFLQLIFGGATTSCCVEVQTVVHHSTLKQEEIGMHFPTLIHRSFHNLVMKEYAKDYTVQLVGNNNNKNNVRCIPPNQLNSR